MTLALFFTRGVSLKQWVDAGMFEREKKIYEAHLEAGNLDVVYWMTYGSQDEALSHLLKSEGRLHPSIIVCQMPAGFNIPKIGSWIYSFLLPLIHSKTLSSVAILKTNQMDGSWSAVFAKLFYKKKLVVRTGYTLSVFLKNQEKSWIKQKIFEKVEAVAYRYSDAGTVSSKQDKEYVTDMYNVPGNKIQVVPNYIDMNAFKLIVSKKYKKRVVFIGRLNKQKNLFNLIDAISKTDLSLDIYGGGELKVDLELHAIKKKVKVRFFGVVPNSELPKILNRYEYYILPSLYEGMPKTLLEAMACGLVCIGTNVQGINEVIKDGVNGYLADTVNSCDLVGKIEEAKRNNNLEISKRARRFVENDFSLISVAQKERKIISLMIDAM